MKFGKVPLAQAMGAVLGHTLRAGERVLKKGRVLSEEDLGALAAAGCSAIGLNSRSVGKIALACSHEI